MYACSTQIRHCVLANTLDAAELEKSLLQVFFYKSQVSQAHSCDLGGMQHELRHTEMIDSTCYINTYNHYYYILTTTMSLNNNASEQTAFVEKGHCEGSTCKGQLLRSFTMSIFVKSSYVGLVMSVCVGCIITLPLPY